MTFNKKQKRIVLISSLIIIASFLVWFFYGAEIFTKTQVLVEITDELFGTTYKEWHDKFIWGLDLTLVVTGATVLLGSLITFLKRDKKH